jgi:acyl carrier protein
MDRMRQEIRQFLTSHQPAETGAGFSDSDSLLETGVIDSMTMVDLIAFIEQQFDIHVDEDDMVPENFDAVDSIVAYVELKRAGR